MSLKDIIHQCEQMIAKYYGFEISTPFIDFIVSENDIAYSTNETKSNLKSGVFVIENKTEDEVFIGACLDEKITENLAAMNPLVVLNKENLNAFCVLVEEISHFHLLVNRAKAGLGVTKVELEWQAEIDKLLFSAEILRFQSGKTHIVPLLKLIFDQCEIIESPDKPLYIQANKLAATFWYKAVSEYKEPTTVRDFRSTLQKLYRVDWDEKRAYCAR